MATAATQEFKYSMGAYGVQGMKRESPAAERNKEPILQVLRDHLPPRLPASGEAPASESTAADGTPAQSSAVLPSVVLEVASGSGQHAAHFAPELRSRGYDIQPSDLTPELFDSIVAYCHDQPNVRLPPLELDMAAEAWPQLVTQALHKQGPAAGSHGIAAVVCINMCHISPVEATHGLLRGAAALLSPGSGLLFVYGPFAVDGAMSEGNAAFDVSLRAKDPAWGLRDTRDVAAWAEAQGLALVATHAMPANNLTLVFRRK